jgi:DNA end-binding protein Ku
MWKGVIRCARQQLAVKLHAAVEDTAVHFHLLHAADGVRVEQRIVDPQTGKAVAAGEIRKGLPVGDGVFVVLEPDELKQLAPKATRDIEIETFVPDTAIPAAWFERPYHLSPDGDVEGYYALAAALRQTRHQGIAHWTMRNKHYNGALRAQDDHLVLIALRTRDEVIAAPELAAPKLRAASEKELALAEQLVSTLEGTFDPTAFKSNYRERVREFVEQKARGKRPKLRAVHKREAAPPSLERALAASLKRARNHTPREKKSA